MLIDPFFTGNPVSRATVTPRSRASTHILITHGHADHVGDAVAISEATGAKVVSNFELCIGLAPTVSRSSIR